MTVWLRVRGRLRRIARYWETESQITNPTARSCSVSQQAALEHLRRAKLVLRFAAIDAAEHHRMVTTQPSLGR